MLYSISNAIYRIIFATILCLAGSVPSALAGMYEDLFRAVDRNDPGWMQDLLKEGGDPNTVDENGNSLVMIASRDGREGVLKVLLESKAKVNTRNKFGETALMLAAIQGHSAVAKQLVFNGAQIEFKGWNPLLYAATGGKDEVVVLLLNVGANVNARSDNGSTPLMMATRAGYSSTVKLLLDRGANPNLKNERGQTALMWAMDYGHTEIGTLLLERGAKD
jgi:uncharacterized protein